MPKRQNNDFFTLDAVVDVVPNSVDLQASSAEELGVLDALTNARLEGSSSFSVERDSHSLA